MKIRTLVVAGAAALLPVFAFAHVGAEGQLHTHSVMQAMQEGFLHPITGFDHLLAMLALGLWCGLMLQRQWLPPLTFAGFMALGLALTQTAFALPAVEPMVAASLLAFGLLLIAQRRLPTGLAMALAAVFASFHGFAHGEVFPTDLNASMFAGYMAGMLAATLLLHATGVVLGQAVQRHARRWAPAAASVVGLAALGYGAFALAA